MGTKPLDGFQSIETHHCVTGSMRHVYLYHGHAISEEMLLGVGGGVGFVYWHVKGTDPFIGGRRKGLPGHGFEECVGHRTGVQVSGFTTGSKDKAERTLISMLGSGQPVMLQVDMGLLPYFDFGGYDYHFGAHFVVACGYDQKSHQVLIADRDKPFHVVSMHQLEQARSSICQPYSPKHRWFAFDFARKHLPIARDVMTAIAEQVAEMLEPPIRNLGIKGIRKAAQMVSRWPHAMSADALRRTMFNSYVLIDAIGGTGGGLFRYMFGRFLSEAAAITGLEQLVPSANEFERLGDQWQEIAQGFKQGSESRNPAPHIADVSKRLLEISDPEETAWRRLRGFLQGLPVRVMDRA